MVGTVVSLSPGRPEFDSQHPNSCSQPFITPVPGGADALFCFHGHHAQTCIRQALNDTLWQSEQISQKAAVLIICLNNSNKKAVVCLRFVQQTSFICNFSFLGFCFRYCRSHAEINKIIMDKGQHLILL